MFFYIEVPAHELEPTFVLCLLTLLSSTSAPFPPPRYPEKAFGAKDPPWGPHLVTVLLTVIPFAYIGLAARVLTRSNRLGKDDDGVGRAVARGGELIRWVRLSLFTFYFLLLFFL